MRNSTTKFRISRRPGNGAARMGSGAFLQSRRKNSRMPTIYHDFETGSPLDLTDVGAWVYSCCPETRVWCMAWAIDDGEVQITIPGRDPVPPEWIKGAADPEWRFSAFNTSFERAITFNLLGPRFNWPVPLLEQYDCSQTLALSYALPATLEGTAAVLKLANQKDAAGSGIMKKWAKPRKARKGEDRQQVYWQDDSKEFEQLCAYCAQDVRTERELSQRLPPLPADERALWLLSEEINERGFYTDGPLIDAAIRVADWFAADINRQLSEVTEGGITTVPQIPHRLDWLREHGYAGEGTDKTVVARQLRRKNLPDIIRQVLDWRQAGAHAAAAKPEAFKRWRAADGRVHGGFKFHGAHTGRWTSYGVQAQNLKRSDPKLDIESAVTAVINDPAEVLRTKYPHTLDMIGSLARAFICAPPGHTLIAADFSGIEARLTAWISGDLPELEQWAKSIARNARRKSRTTSPGSRILDCRRSKRGIQAKRARSLSASWAAFRLGAKSRRSRCRRTPFRMKRCCAGATLGDRHILAPRNSGAISTAPRFARCRRKDRPSPADGFHSFTRMYSCSCSCRAGAGSPIRSPG